MLMIVTVNLNVKLIKENHLKIIISWEKISDKSLILEFYKFGS
jgi:hypothetical protein